MTEKQGQGIGTQLLVAIENENIELYEKSGYKIFREKQITDELKFVYLEKLT